jgi:antitoxin HigA-1
MKIPLTNPATGLLTDELEHRGISQKKLAEACKVSPSIISDILCERRRISSEMALRLEITLGIEAVFILRLQQTYELKKFKSELSSQLAKDLQPI